MHWSKAEFLGETVAFYLQKFEVGAYDARRWAEGFMGTAESIHPNSKGELFLHFLDDYVLLSEKEALEVCNAAGNHALERDAARADGRSHTPLFFDLMAVLDKRGDYAV